MRKYNQSSDFGSLFSGVTAMVSPAHQAITERSLYEQVAPLEFRPQSWPLARLILDTLLRWHHRVNERQALVKLDDRLLQDIGIERSQAVRESEKPFWQV